MKQELLNLKLQYFTSISWWRLQTSSTVLKKKTITTKGTTTEHQGTPLVTSHHRCLGGTAQSTPALLWDVSLSSPLIVHHWHSSKEQASFPVHLPSFCLMGSLSHGMTDALTNAEADTVVHFYKLHCVPKQEAVSPCLYSLPQYQKSLWNPAKLRYWCTLLLVCSHPSVFSDVCSWSNIPNAANAAALHKKGANLHTFAQAQIYSLCSHTS